MTSKKGRLGTLRTADRYQVGHDSKRTLATDSFRACGRLKCLSPEDNAKTIVVKEDRQVWQPRSSQYR